MPTAPDRHAIIDIGSNSIRLVVFGPGREVLYNDKVLAGLGRGVVANGRIDREARSLALATLKRYAALLTLIKPDHLQVVATAAVREADNGGEFLAAVRALGLPAELLSGEDEARGSAWGVLAHFPDARGVVADLGGGSLELARIAYGGVHECVSFPLGVLRIAAIRAEGRGRLRKTVRKALAPLDWTRQVAGQELFLVGGAWRALAKIEARLGKHDPAASFAPEEARRLKIYAKRMGPEWLATVPGISAARAVQLEHAAALLVALVGELAPSSITVTRAGLREGLVAGPPPGFPPD
jgi:exopolyphosphatase/guanosine-5'-triphosphate,3'-diphosphate pyrophosphatase